MVSPFGRLVDTKSLGPKAAPRVERRITDVERAQDRMTVYRLLEDVGDAANVCLKQLREDFEPALMAMARTLFQQIEGPSTLPRDYRAYVVAVKQRTPRARH